MASPPLETHLLQARSCWLISFLDQQLTNTYLLSIRFASLLRIPNSSSKFGQEERSTIIRFGWSFLGRQVRRASVAIVVNDRFEILFARRSKTQERFPGLWEFPGGEARPKERFITALSRELLEELDIHISTASLLRYSTHADQIGEPWRVATFVCPINDDHSVKIIEPDKCDEIIFLSPLDPPEPLMDPAADDLRFYLERWNLL